MGCLVQAVVANRGIDLDLTLPTGQVTAVIGPNGAGKTTLLQLLAGLLRPDSGQVVIDSQLVAGPGVFWPPHRRRTVLLTQDAALFPHLSVLENVAFGPRATGASPALAKERALAELAAVNGAELAARRPHELSGGQAQRVAIARALATDPELVLLDEPMSGLDVAVAAQIRHLLAQRLRGRTALLVTHEVLDLWTIADRVVLLQDGQVAEQGAVAELLHRPTRGFLARLSGLNLLTGELHDDGLRLAPEVLLQGLGEPERYPTAEPEGLAAFSPAAVSVHLVAPGGSPRNALASEVVGFEPRGEVVRVQLASHGQPFAADLTAQAVAELGLRPGLKVVAVVKATQIRLYGR